MSKNTRTSADMNEPVSIINRKIQSRSTRGLLNSRDDSNRLIGYLIFNMSMQSTKCMSQMQNRQRGQLFKIRIVYFYIDELFNNISIIVLT